MSGLLVESGKEANDLCPRVGRSESGKKGTVELGINRKRPWQFALRERGLLAG